jgi:hypothetical protein
MQLRYTKDELVQILQRVAERGPGKPLTWRGYDELRRGDEPSANTFMSSSYFGSWRAAIKAAGLEPSITGPRKR